MRDFYKIFVISLPRHGTTTMFNALGTLGIPISHLGKIYGEEQSAHDGSLLDYDPARIERIAAQSASGDFCYDILDECRGLSDMPTPAVFEHLYDLFPNSLFIHVTRPEDEWIESYKRMSVGMDVLQKSNPDQRLISALKVFRKMAFGVSSFEEDAMRAGYRNHYRRVDEFFADNSDCFLRVNLANLTPENGYKLLCDFLKCDVPDADFPRANEHSAAPVQAYDARL